MKVKTILLTTILTMVTVFSGFTASELLDDFDILYEMAVSEKVRIKREKEEDKKKAEEAKKRAEEDRIAAEKKAEEDRKKAEEKAKKDSIEAEKKRRCYDEVKAYAVNSLEIMQKTNSMMYVIPGKDYLMLNTEVTQELYESIMGENPSYFQIGSKEYEEERDMPYAVTAGEDVKKLPIENISWYDAIYFCNKLSERCGLRPVYAVGNKTDVTKWNYIPHQGKSIRGKIKINEGANGFRLPTKEEWVYATKGGENYMYSGSDNLDEVGWYDENSNFITHEVAKKKSNGYVLYDMSGNVGEWCWDTGKKKTLRCYRGGDVMFSHFGCEVYGFSSDYYDASARREYIGFRIVCKAE